ncbi:MAG: sulfurtransferase-like selenium metabolism protein YedF [Candidatus Syntrophonatronum acetioxidans]|uniref:Sulfurtransferase-like selenium metabolism protein YedF n=1 Tax=Candidatus Syntrophonatronum acetioxidans TaxID=1795816 RepID=A0A424YFB2_9FIRM|nr:MAG: sulfurtransferase-like selenium metabolism protein YedF [Candidatus Syntrophonatronum acetioxidans]
MNKTVDARGLQCPEPVILTKKALEEMEEGTLVVIVDSEAARTNVSNMASARACAVEVEERKGAYHITITKGENVCDPYDFKNKLVIVLGSDMLGRGSEELGRVLMKSYIYALLEGEEMPQSIIFINRGIFLTIKDSEVLEDLKRLGKKGVEILSCGTCLDYFQQKENLGVGSITNMYTITEKMAAGNKVYFL